MPLLEAAAYLGSVLCIFFIPGFLLTYIIPDGVFHYTLTERILHTLIFSLALTIFGGYLLTLSNGFTSVNLWVMWLSVIFIEAVVLWRRRFSPAAAWQGIKTTLSNTPKTTLALLLITIAVATAPFVYWSAESVTPSLPVVWYYYREADAIVENQTLPDSLVEYGIEMAYLNDKHGHKLIGASLIANTFSVASPQTVQLTLLVMSHLILTAGLWAFMRRHVSPLYAAAAVIWISWLPLALKMNLYRSEGFSVALLFTVLYFIDKAFHTKRTGDAVIISLSLALTALAHPISGVAGIYWYTGMAAALLIYNFKAFIAYIPKMMLTTVLTVIPVLAILLSTGNGAVLTQEFERTSLDEFPQITDAPSAFRHLVTQGNLDFPAMAELESGNQQPSPLIPTLVSESVLVAFGPILAHSLTMTAVFVLLVGYFIYTGVLLNALPRAQIVMIALVSILIPIAARGWSSDAPPATYISLILFVVGLCSVYLINKRSPIGLTYVVVALLLMGMMYLLNLSNVSTILSTHIERRHIPYLAPFTAILICIGLHHLDRDHTAAQTVTDETGIGTSSRHLMKTLWAVAAVQLAMQLPLVFAWQSDDPILFSYSASYLLYVAIVLGVILFCAAMVSASEWIEAYLANTLTSSHQSKWLPRLAALIALVVYGVVLFLVYQRDFLWAHNLFGMLLVPILIGAYFLPSVVAQPVEKAAGITRSNAVRYGAVLLVMVITWGVVRGNFNDGRRVTAGRPLSQAFIESMAWLQANTPEDATIISNLWTYGIVDVRANRTALTEGRAPYFQPANLEVALTSLLHFYNFFEQPNADTLTRFDVDYVVYVQDPDGIGGGLLYYREDDTLTMNRLRTTPYLALQYSDVGSIHIFKVNRADVVASQEADSAATTISNP